MTAEALTSIVLITIRKGVKHCAMLHTTRAFNGITPMRNSLFLYLIYEYPYYISYLRCLSLTMLLGETHSIYLGVIANLI
jgi:hypothetical protein